MTIIFAGGEDTGIIVVAGSATANASTAFLRSTFARTNIQVQGGATDPPANRFACPTFSPVSTVWIHGRFGNNGTGNATTSNAQLLRVMDSGVARILVRGTGTAGQLKVDKRNSAGTITNLVTGTSGLMTGLNTSGQTISFDLQLIVGVSGTINLYLDGTLAATFSGDTTTDSNTTVNQVEFSDSSTTTIGWSELIVADQDTRGMSVWTIAPQAAGNTQSFTPNTLANINDTIINDTTLISEASNNALSQWTTPTTPPSGTWNVRAIVQEARVEVGTSGPAHFDWSVRTASTDFLAGLSVAPTTSFGNFSNIWSTNPNTSLAWAITDIASGFNLGIKSLA